MTWLAHMTFVWKYLIVILTVLYGHTAWAAPHLTVDLGTGKVLSQQQAFDPWHPASLTKLMTAYSVFRAIQSGDVQANQMVRISKNARRQPPSRMGYRTGTSMTLDDALKLLIIKSANDISVAIAESVSGSVKNFSTRMNQDAQRLGMTGAYFVNPHGLHDNRQVTTARDMALLVRAIHKQFPQYRNLFETPSVLAPNRTKNGKTIQRIYYSYNLLLERYRGADGFKTGFVCASGYNFIGAATRSGRRISAIVLGRDSQTSRAVDAARLITQGFELPIYSGTAISALKPTGPIPTGARNMRSILCTEKARAARYEPGAGQAVINSKWLLERNVSKSPLRVALGGGVKQNLVLASIPLPSFRPVDLPEKSEIPIPANTSNPEPSVRVAIPTFRPSTQ